jgi:hypothetical protein
MGERLFLFRSVPRQVSAFFISGLKAFLDGTRVSEYKTDYKNLTASGRDFPLQPE